MIGRTPRYTGPERRSRPRRRLRPLRALLILLAIAGAGYAGAVLWLMTQETRLVFEAVKTLGDARPPFPYEHVDLPRDDGVRQFAWAMPLPSPRDEPWVLYLHGSPTTVASPVNIAHYRLLRELGFSVLAPEYRGFGGLEGVPREDTLEADARAAYDYLRTSKHVAPSSIVVYGWSLGAALAVKLAGDVRLPALILEGAPTSAVDMTRQRYPFIPFRLLMRNPFDSIGKIGRVTAPTLFLHSAEDDVVPLSQGRRLYDAAPGDKQFVEVRGGHLHATEVDGRRMAQAIGEFLTSHGVRPALNAADGSSKERIVR